MVLRLHRRPAARHLLATAPLESTAKPQRSLAPARGPGGVRCLPPYRRPGRPPVALNLGVKWPHPQRQGSRRGLRVPSRLRHPQRSPARLGRTFDARTLRQNIIEDLLYLGLVTTAIAVAGLA